MGWKNLSDEIAEEFEGLSSVIDPKTNYALINSKEARWAKTTTRDTVEGGKSFKDRYHADPENYRNKAKLRQKRWRMRQKALKALEPQPEKKTHKLTSEQVSWALSCNLSDSETAKALGVVRQYVNRIRKQKAACTIADGP